MRAGISHHKKRKVARQSFDNKENNDPNIDINPRQSRHIVVATPEKFRKNHGRVFSNKATEAVAIDHLKLFLLWDIKQQSESYVLDKSLPTKLKLVFDAEFKEANQGVMPLMCTENYIRKIVTALHKYDNVKLFDWATDYLLQVKCVTDQAKKLLRYPLRSAICIKQNNPNRASINSMKLLQSCPQEVRGFESKEFTETGMSFLLCMKECKERGNIVLPRVLQYRVLDMLRDKINNERSL